MIDIEAMIDAIAMVMEEHELVREDGHRLTTEELCALPYEEVLLLFNFCYGED